MISLVIFLFLLATGAHSQDNADRLTYQEEQELKTLLDEALKASPGSMAINFGDASIKRKFDLASRVAQLGLLKLNKSMKEKKYAHESDFVGFYISRYGKMFDEAVSNTWLVAYASNNAKEKAFFDKELGKTGLTGNKRNTVIQSFYQLLYPAERLFYIEIVSIVYRNGQADFSLLTRRAKDWVANHNDMFP